MPRLLSATPVLSAIALACLSAHAADPATPSTDAASPAAQQVIVTATRSPRALSELPVSASVVSSTDIEDTPAFALDDVLRHVAGVNLPIQSGILAHPTADGVSMRGLGGIHALVLVDGVPVNDPFFGYVQWARLPLANIDRVEIVRGGGSPLWGNYAMGGTINVITRADTFDNLELDAAGGNLGTYRTDLHGSLGVGGSNHLTLDAGLQGTDGFQAVPDDARRPFDRPTRFHARNFQLGDRFAPGDGLTASLTVTHHENEQHLGTVVDSNHQSTTTTVASARREFADHSSLAGSLFYTSSRFVTDNSTTTDSSLPLAEQTEHLDNVHTTPYTNAGGSLVWARSFDGLLRTLTVGADFNNVRGSDSAAIYDTDGATRIRTDYGSGKESFVGAFAQASIVPMREVEVLASARAQRFSVLDGYDGNPGGAGTEPDRHYNSFDPRLSVRWAAAPHVALRGAAYKAFRAPTLDNLYRGFASDGGIYYPNSQLHPETLQGGELGLDFDTKSLHAQFTVYRTRISNLITTADLDASQLPAGFFYGGRLVNAGSARAQGVESSLNWTISPSVSATIAYTWADSRYRSNPEDPASVGKQLQDVPRNTASAGAAYSAPTGWRVSADARYVSATSWTSADHSDPGAPYQASADPHFIVDVAASVPVRRDVDVRLQIQNLFDRRYIVNPGPYNPPQYGTPFQAMLGLRLRFE